MKGRLCEELSWLSIKRTGLYPERKLRGLDADESTSSHYVPLLVVASHGWQIASDFRCLRQNLRFRRSGNCIYIRVARATYCSVLFVPFAKIVDSNSGRKMVLRPQIALLSKN